MNGVASPLGREEVAQTLELQDDIHRPDSDMIRRRQLHRREVQDGSDAGLCQLPRGFLRRIGRGTRAPASRRTRTD